MNWQNAIVSLSALIAIAGCGVKGDPLPPEKPAELGRGRPTYKRATEGLKIDRSRPQDEDEEEDDERE